MNTFAFPMWWNSMPNELANHRAAAQERLGGLCAQKAPLE